MEDNFLEKFLEKKRQVARLMHECENLKKQLSFVENQYRAMCGVHKTFQEKHKDCSFITRGEYQDIQRELEKEKKRNETFSKAMARIHNVAKNAEYLTYDRDATDLIYDIDEDY